MKLGDCFMDNYYEPETIVLKVTVIKDAPSYKCKVVYTSDSHRLEMGETVTRLSNDNELIPVAMITIDNKVILINL